MEKKANFKGISCIFKEYCSSSVFSKEKADTQNCEFNSSSAKPPPYMSNHRISHLNEPYTNKIGDCHHILL